MENKWEKEFNLEALTQVNNDKLQLNYFEHREEKSMITVNQNL